MKLTVAFVAILLMTMACTSNNNKVPPEEAKMASAKAKGNLQKIYVEEAEPQQMISSNEEIQVNVRGNLPSPAYTFDHFDIKVQGTVVQITPLAKYDSTKMAAQVLVPFDSVCTVKNLKPGDYQIVVDGRSREVKLTRKVKVQQ